MEQKENEIKGKELFELSLTFTEGDEDKQFSVTMKAKKDGKETSLDLFDSDFIEMSYNGVKMVFSQITYLYVKNLHDTGRISDEEYNAIMAHAGQQPQSKADNEEEITKILFEKGYILNYKFVEDGPQGTIKVALKYNPTTKQNAIKCLKRVSTPGLRKYTGYKDMPRVINGLGIAILSTSKGVMTDKEAADLKIGGEVLCYIY